MLRRFSIVLVLSGCLTLTVLGQEAKKADAPAKSPAAKNDAESKDATHQVKSERLKIEVNLTGIFEPTKMTPVVLRPESWSSFTVIKAVPHGKKVKKGDTLVELDMTKIDEQLTDLELSRQLSKLTQQVAEKDFELLRETIPLDLKSAEREKTIANEEFSSMQRRNSNSSRRCTRPTTSRRRRRR